ncbi:Endoglucanase E [Pyrenophora tritici-repentis]|uniref:Endoglucanase E n=2 Tax=Pyrenophora tritici-repentis TaxID=45151 RepID=A0A2W1CX69_9PLEO|nr:endoglucanase E precursor [Pyrenophora tritici-repentis Pt-1C-BFP]KAF7449382.1 Endoglucanase E [Pyrenophora tritici-repentis]EDU48739.1 endoglucanase E precursor [Pyrenophora tritici-repentis Pt-1C-BFP]KAG9383627.1 Endoglucanase E [Pyrenophora tritici-repentis]KAI1514485.1 Endoglucanase E [Pyrenophora tritici-repentis]KAI1667040.1 Endoglucanase E [Pyrenophora tritici-repentis]
MKFSATPIFVLIASIEHATAVRFLGRVNPATRELTWPGTGVSFSFSGTTASIGLEGISGSNSAELVVDGVSTVILNVNGTSINTPSSLPRSQHTVTLRKRSEALFGTITIGNITTPGGTLTADTLPKRKIQFIGDSITVGYGLDGTFPCTNDAAVENNPRTYAALAATAVNADYDIIAWSGIGLTRNYISSTPDPSDTMPQRWTRYGALDPRGSYTFPPSATPNAVVINLGTNDFGYQAGIRDPIVPSNFTAAMVSFVKTIQGRYPKATFFLLTSPMLGDGYPADQMQKTVQKGALEEAKKVLSGKAKVVVVDIPTQGSVVGCDYHPNAQTHKEEAAILEAALKKGMGW